MGVPVSSPLDGLTTATVHLLAGGRVDRIFGPPGTGKSTRLKRMIRDFAQQFGSDAVLVTSFTVTAAKSIAAMGLPLPDRQVGTLHSAAYRSLGTPDVALDPKVLKEWNATARWDWRLTADGRRGHPELAAEAGTGGGGGDELLATYDGCRSQLIPLNSMPADVREFAAAWEAWKTGAEAVDYTDMIYVALQRALDGERAPGNPRVIIADEAQDMTPLEIALVLAWGRLAGHTVLALDDDQAIMDWRGGNCEPILALGVGLDGGEQLDVAVCDTMLEQSHRIPAAVHNVAQSWIERCSYRREKNYAPRAVDGQIYSVGATLESKATAEQVAKDIHAGREVMVLAACEYMLRPLIANLKVLGVPFCNRYRPAEPRWNPLRSSSGMTAAERLFRYLVMDEESLGGWATDHRGGRARLWTGDDVRAWLELVGAKEAGLVRGAKGPLIKHLPSGELSIAQVEGLFEQDAEEHLVRATQPELAWLMEVALPTQQKRLAYPAAVAKAHGPAALIDPPSCVIGTIHSVKGGQAGRGPTDTEPGRAGVVYLCPSVSGAGWLEWSRGGKSRDRVIRQFYVGLTRSYTTTVILGSGERSIPASTLIPPGMMVR